MDIEEQPGGSGREAGRTRKVIHIDIDPSSISKRVKVDVPIVGNVPDVLDEMLKLVEGSKPEPAQTADADTESADASTPADDTERPSGDDA